MANSEDQRDSGWIPRSGNGHPLQYYLPGKSMDGGVWRAAVPLRLRRGGHDLVTEHAHTCGWPSRVSHNMGCRLYREVLDE